MQHFYSRQKGREFYDCCKQKICKINRKKKKKCEYITYEVSKEEIKNINKRSKSMNYGKYFDIG